MKSISRALAATAAAFFAAGATLLSTGTAQATAIDCENYLRSLGYPITYAIWDGCSYGEVGLTYRCWDILTEGDVIYGDAREACRRAAL
ncbi:hypothetical protein FHX81_5656 [Saccharothrix saharensis]|uniref:Uncharacterized protein n=1 Tax=Saccharothrix saharensis TaxID=571190 RepID=A0A543JKH0_9PSEU|nr:hypothetical protein [Saccharothrix saharensis]TQM83238.1 hypothetical protein FHX81_5656 [Saccharothrix saharensis]